MKTLYVSDLDGTLLNKDQQISKDSIRILNELIEEGVRFTVATARTPATVVPILDEVNIDLPVALMNGVLIYDINKKEYIEINHIEKTIVDKAIKVFESKAKDMFIYGIENERLNVYYKGFSNESEKKYYEERCNSPLKTFVKVKSYDEISCDVRIINFVIIDEYKNVKTIYDELFKIKEMTVNFYEDIYSEGHYFLDAYTSKASKGLAIKELSKYISHDKLVCFGDNVNDIPMFEVADECYAVENAAESLKHMATKVIGNNNNDAVAEFIKEQETVSKSN